MFVPNSQAEMRAIPAMRPTPPLAPTPVLSRIPEFPAIPDANKTTVRTDICAKWNKFSEHDLATLRNKDDLVTQIVGKYGLERSLVQSEVDALLKGRSV